MFGRGARTEGILKHIESEIVEVRSKPHDLMEWVDIVILALDGAWRSGYTPGEIVEALEKKQAINIRRDWPMPTSEDEPAMHIKEPKDA